MTKLIAETAWHHEGDYSFMRNLICEICEKSDADFVKMHVSLDLDEYMLKDHDAYDLLKSWMLTEQQWTSLIEIVQNSDKGLMLLLNDTKAVEFAMKYNPEIVELHSVCLNIPRLQRAVLESFDINTEIVIGVGGCSVQEVDAAIRVFEGRETVLMFGFQNYPTKYADVNLSKIRKIQSLYSGSKFGYADHTAWDEENNQFITTVVAANGMDYIEKHITTSYGKDRCDFSAAISIDMFNDLSKKVKVLDEVYGDGALALNEGEKSYSQNGPMKMAAVARRTIAAGSILEESDFSFCRTGQKSDISQIEVIENLGKEVCERIDSGVVISKGSFQ